MNDFKLYAEANDWGLLVPEISLAFGALLLLCREALRKQGRESGGGLAFLLQGGLLVYFVARYLFFDPRPDSAGESAFNGMIQQSFPADVMRCFFLGCAFLTSLFANPGLRERRLPQAEFHALVSLAAASMMMLVQSNHFLMLFVSLETVAVCFYVLVSYHRGSPYSLEAGLKYLVFGALSSAILLFGIALLYGTAASWSGGTAPSDPLSFTMLEQFVAANSDSLAVRAGTAFVLAGLAFKLGAAPFQAWVPDVYQGAPTAVTAYLAVASKSAGFVVLFNLVTGPLFGLREFLIPLLSLVAIITILFGNLGALTQTNVKRLMGFSGVAHAGYLLVGIIAAIGMHPDVPEKSVFWAIVFYLLSYSLASYGVFGVMGVLAPTEDADQPRSLYSSLAQKQPFLAFTLAVGLGSLAGIPPLAGFIGKLLLFVVAFQAELYGLLAVMVMGVVIAIYYYFAWIRETVFPPLPSLDSSDKEPQVLWSPQFPSLLLACILGLLTLTTILLGFYQSSLGQSF